MTVNMGEHKHLYHPHTCAGGKTYTPLTHPLAGKVEENNMNECETEKRVEVVKRLQMAFYTHLWLMCSYACFFFTLCNGKFLIFARDLGISCVHTHVPVEKNMLIYSPGCRVCTFTYGTYIFAKAVNHTCTRLSPGFCMCTGPFDLEEFSS